MRKKASKSVLSMALAVVMFLSLLPMSARAADMPSSWAEEDVTAAISAKLVPQDLQGKYTQAATRAEFCALAVALYETVKGTEIGERQSFGDTTDVNVEKAAGIGVVNGVGDGKFAPNTTLTREQAATMLSRLANVLGRPLTSQAATFADHGSISSWAADAVGQVQASGIMGGVGNNTFAPGETYTREQSMITVLRLYNMVKDMIAPAPTQKGTSSVTYSVGHQIYVQKAAEFWPEDGAVWYSSNKDVAYVDTDGWMTAAGPGEAVLDCVFQGETIYSLTVTVEGETVPEPQEEPLYDRREMLVGEEFDVSTLADTTSSNTNVAYINSAKQLVAVAPGTTTVRGILEREGGRQVIVTFTVTAPEEKEPEVQCNPLPFDPEPVMGEQFMWYWTHAIGWGTFAPDVVGLWYFYSDGWYYACQPDGTVFLRSSGNTFTVTFGVRATPPAPNGPTPGLPTK